MTSTDNPAEHQIAIWHVITGSARGAAHRARGLPNQDAVASRDGPGGAVTVAVADGHGHARHFRSAEGAALAVDIACRTASRMAAELTAGHAVRAGAAGEELARAIVADWRAAVTAELAAWPYTAREQSVLDLGTDSPEVPYGSTLLVATIAAGRLVCAQIGDGDMLAVRTDGSFFIPVAADDRLDGQHTTSLCQADAVESFRTAAYDLREVPVATLLLATDGYGNAQADEPWQPGVGRDLAELVTSRDHHWFERQVPDWAQRCASAEGSGDDTTIALLLRTGVGGSALRGLSACADAGGGVPE